MKQVSIPDGVDIEKLRMILEENLEEYLLKEIKNNQIYMARDINTDEWNIIKVAIKLCPLQEN